MRRGLLILLLVVAPGPGVAHAGTLTFTPAVTRLVPPDCAEKCGGPVSVSFPATLDYRAAAGEANDVTLVSDGATFVLRDAAGVALAGPAPPCSPVDETTVRCDRRPTMIRVGDGNDRADAAGTGLFGDDGDDVLTGTVIDGGTGDDTLVGVLPSHDEGTDELALSVFGSGSLVGLSPVGPRLTGAVLAGSTGRDHLTGTDAPDRLVGGPGADTIEAGGGDDRISGLPDPAGPDSVDGGAGTDTADYQAATVGVTLDLAAPQASTDALTGVENLLGTRFADVLRGDDGPNAITASALDVVDGRGGDDLLELDGVRVAHGGDGNDRIDLGISDGSGFVDAGAGDDLITNLSALSIVRCGAGRDRANSVSAFFGALVATDCESAGGRVPLLRRGRGSIRTDIPCSTAIAEVTACVATATLRDGAGRVLARARRTFGPGHRDDDFGTRRSSELILRIPQRIRALLHGRRRIAVRLHVERRATADDTTSSEHGSMRLHLSRRDLSRTLVG